MRAWLFLVFSFLSVSILAADKVNINTASAEELAAAIDGVGKAKAEAIVAHRELHGPFASVEELSVVQGIGARTVEMNRDALTVDSTADSTVGSNEPTTQE